MLLDHSIMSKGHFKTKSDLRNTNTPGIEPGISLTGASSSESEPPSFSFVY